MWDSRFIRAVDAAALGLGLVLGTGGVHTAHGRPTDGLVARSKSVSLSKTIRLEPGRSLATSDTSVVCFESDLRILVNAGCFPVDGAGGCVSSDTHFFVQYLFPEFESPHRILGLAFLGNTAGTVYPSAGVLLLPFPPRFPTPQELANLQVQNIPTTADTTTVVVDLQPFDLVFEPGTIVTVCLQFPDGGTLVGPGEGPGIGADGDPPNPDCDYFTVTAGNGTAENPSGWWRPDPDDPEPLDWGFEVIFEPTTAVQTSTWSAIRQLYRAP